VLLAGVRWFPRGTAGLAAARREAGTLEAEEARRGQS
jgi:hypothetical protein